jgi:hypothetical protein
MDQETAVKETVRLPTRSSSWRGSYEDLRTDLDLARELVSRRAPDEDTAVTYSIDLRRNLDEGRTREYTCLDDLVHDVDRLGPRVSEIETSVANSVVSLTMTMMPARGVEITVRGNAVDAEGVRSEIRRHLANRGSLPAEALTAATLVAMILGAFAFFVTLTRWATVEAPSFARVAFPIALAAFAVAVAVRVILGRTFPRLEFVEDHEPRSYSLRRRLGRATGYVATAVLGAVADHFFR